MSFTVRTAEGSDFTMVLGWYDKVGNKPDRKFFPPTSVILESKGVALLFGCLICTNTPLAWLEFFVGNPDYPGEERREATIFLTNWVAHFAKTQGYSRLFCMATNDRLKSYYKRLGYREVNPDGKGYALIKDI